jgi:hypothetical protein
MLLPTSTAVVQLDRIYLHVLARGLESGIKLIEIVSQYNDDIFMKNIIDGYGIEIYICMH